MPSNKCGMTPMCSLFLPLGSVAVQNSESRMSCPNDENNRSATCNTSRYQMSSQIVLEFNINVSLLYQFKCIRTKNLMTVLCCL